MAVVATVATMGLATTATAQSGFTDIGSSFHRADIETLTQRGLFEGTECADEQFCPNEPAKRWAVAVWLVRALDGGDPPPVEESRFTDVDNDEWWTPHVERLARLGVTAGCGTEPLRFCPDGTVTRGQMASFLVRAFDLGEAPSAGFDDTAGTAHESDIDRLFASGITAGCKQDPLRFCPGRTVSRAEMATLIVRGLAHRAKASWFTIPEGPRGNDTLISAGRGRTCAVRVDGGVACWGRDGLRERFALAGLQNVVQISGADDPVTNLHACALHTGGSISCWGNGFSGQLGQGDTSSHYLPVAVPGVSDAVGVSAGSDHTCAVHRDGGVSCWGFNVWGQLGDGTTADYYLPKRVAGVSDVVAVAAASSTSCAVHRDGAVSCWGHPHELTPTRLDLPEAMSSVAIGELHACAVSTSGALYCWRYHWFPTSSSLAKVLTEVVEVSVGDGTFCALHRDGGVSCWGENNSAGQVGDGTTTPRPEPVRLARVSDAVAVSVSIGSPEVGAHACALHEDGSASCWGGNELGQLGDGTTDNRPVPARVERVEGIPADQVPTTSTDLLRAWLDAEVNEREADFPWLRVAWDHIRDQAWVVQSGFGGFVYSGCHASADSFGCTAESMNMTELALGGVVHELLHVYDLHTGLAPPRAWGAVQLYFATTYPGCWSDGDMSGSEVLADTVSHVMVPGAWLTYYNSPGCPTLPVPSEPTAEAEQVVLQGLAGQVPDWYTDNITDGAELWAAWLRGPSLPALANLAGEFGGLCSTDWIAYPLDLERFPAAGSKPVQGRRLLSPERRTRQIAHVTAAATRSGRAAAEPDNPGPAAGERSLSCYWKQTTPPWSLIAQAKLQPALTSV